jgi:DNA repair protein RadA/Sms
LALAEVPLELRARMRTGILELDRVLGGGVLPGSAILLGGEPGVGKSTIVLQALAGMSAGGHACLYVSCEESLPQLRMRAERLGLQSASLAVSAETALENILELVTARSVQLVAVDSIQRVSAPGVESAPGSLRQVSACALALTEAAREAGCALLLVGHVTKQGTVSGPRALEHLVDTVLYFESERFQSLRVLRAAKNRFGAVNEIGVFEMGSEGLRQVQNPSELFLAERDARTSGSVVTAAMEGSRALLVEVQALVGPAAYGTPERKASGMDYRRFSMMIAVLERQAGLELAKCDAFVNVAGGVRVDEPAADLPMALALAGSLRNRPFFRDGMAVGEVGLGGEVRAVSRIEDRLREAAKMGFGRVVIPSHNAQAAEGLGLDVRPVRHLRDAIELDAGTDV